MFGSRTRGNRDDAGLAGDREPARGHSSSDTWTWILLSAGVFLRVIEYADNRALYFDEELLQRNLVGIAFYDFRTPLSDGQLAPPGFIALERLLILLPLPFPPAARLLPFFCSIASMFLMRSVARRYLTAAAVPIAVGFFALTDWMLYYSVEIKQYSSDVMLTLSILLLAAGSAATRHNAIATTRRELVLLTIFGAIGVWFSHPLALVLAGVGTFLILKAAALKDFSRALAFVAMSLFWALSFVVCYRISIGLISDGWALERWWAFAFLPFPPRSLAELKQIFLQSINLLNSPSGVLTPLGVIPSVSISLGLFLLGAWSLARRWKGGLILLVSPILVALVASMLHRYPFHGRLLLFLVPSVHLLVAEGAAALSRPGGARLTFALGAFLLAQPVLDVCWYRAIQKRHHSGYDSHGDLHPDVLDYLDGLKKNAQRDEMLRRAKANQLEGVEQPPTHGQGDPAPP
jgi:hypothetical protein